MSEANTLYCVAAQLKVCCRYNHEEQYMRRRLHDAKQKAKSVEDQGSALVYAGPFFGCNAMQKLNQSLQCSAQYPLSQYRSKLTSSPSLTTK